jgi:uncharacterized membrane protein required for colicin V production
MRFVDHGVGFVFGLLRGLLIVLALVWAIELIPGMKPALAEQPSKLLPYFVSGVDTLKPYVEKISLPDVKELQKR